MDSPGDKSISWPDEGAIFSKQWLQNSAIFSDVVPTSDPNLTVSIMSEELPALTVTTIVGMTVVMLIAILAVFILGVLIDCRQQRLLEKKMGEAKRMKTSRRVNTIPEAEDTSIANNMEEPGMSEPPAADALRHIP